MIVRSLLDGMRVQRLQADGTAPGRITA
jgi:hypothetical protein